MAVDGGGERIQQLDAQPREKTTSPGMAAASGSQANGAGELAGVESGASDVDVETGVCNKEIRFPGSVTTSPIPDHQTGPRHDDVQADAQLADLLYGDQDSQSAESPQLAMASQTKSQESAIPASEVPATAATVLPEDEEVRAELSALLQSVEEASEGADENEPESEDLDVSTPDAAAGGLSKKTTDSSHSVVPSRAVLTSAAELGVAAITSFVDMLRGIPGSLGSHGDNGDDSMLLDVDAATVESPSTLPDERDVGGVDKSPSLQSSSTRVVRSPSAADDQESVARAEDAATVESPSTPPDERDVGGVDKSPPLQSSSTRVVRSPSAADDQESVARAEDAATVQPPSTPPTTKAKRKRKRKPRGNNTDLDSSTSSPIAASLSRGVFTHNDTSSSLLPSRPTRPAIDTTSQRTRTASDDLTESDDARVRKKRKSKAADQAASDGSGAINKKPSGTPAKTSATPAKPAAPKKTSAAPAKPAAPKKTSATPAKPVAPKKTSAAPAKPAAPKKTSATPATSVAPEKTSVTPDTPASRKERPVVAKKGAEAKKRTTRPVIYDSSDESDDAGGLSDDASSSGSDDSTLARAHSSKSKPAQQTKKTTPKKPTPPPQTKKTAAKKRSTRPSGGNASDDAGSDNDSTVTSTSAKNSAPTSTKAKPVAPKTKPVATPSIPANKGAPGKKRAANPVVEEDSADDDEDYQYTAGEDSEDDGNATWTLAPKKNPATYTKAIAKTNEGESDDTEADSDADEGEDEADAETGSQTSLFDERPKSRLVKSSVPVGCHPVREILSYKGEGPNRIYYIAWGGKLKKNELRNAWVSASAFYDISLFDQDIKKIDAFRASGYATMKEFLASGQGQGYRIFVSHGADGVLMSCGYDSVGVALGLLGKPDMVKPSDIAAFREAGMKRRKRTTPFPGVTWKALRKFVEMLGVVDMDVLNVNLFDGKGHGIRGLRNIRFDDGIYLIAGYAKCSLGHCFVAEVTCNGTGLTLWDNDEIQDIDWLLEWFDHVSFVRRVLLKSG